MNWLRQDLRLAIYLRDGCCCVFCGDCGRLSVDHFTPVSRGGSNEPSNLMTVCASCNYSRKDRPVALFVRESANGSTADVIRRVKNVRRRQLDRSKAKRLVQMYGSARKALDRLI